MTLTMRKPGTPPTPDSEPGSSPSTTCDTSPRRALATPADQSSFRAYDLNQPQDPAGQLLIEAADWRACEVEELPAADGPMVLGVDLSSGYAMSAAAAYWPETGRLQGICAFPSEPGLRERGTFDGVGRTV